MKTHKGRGIRQKGSLNRDRWLLKVQEKARLSLPSGPESRSLGFLKERLCEDASDRSSEERSLSVMTKKE